MPRKSRRATKRKLHRRRKTAKGGFYSFNGAIAPGAPAWGRQSEYGQYNLSDRGGNGAFQYGRGRKKTKSKRGGGKFGAVSASYQGQGSKGLIDVAQITTKYPMNGPAAGGEFNNFGAGPNSGHSSFVRI